ncbi:hypothetical protein [Loigolactobacillus zhaoyuanensis]|uniref:Uncharacterized protein n=1 Tax=Loigolactobacillus zhaoyuanensis TaxID=2486017 RepID=A0ABW8UDJ0_9LACO
MTNHVLIKQRAIQALIIPNNFKLVTTETHRRNREEVRVERYQMTPEFSPNNAHITLVYGADERLISYNRFYVALDQLTLPIKGVVIQIAEQVWQTVDADYARGLHYMRTDKQQRYFIDDQGVRQAFAVQWVKFAHDNGSYNWASIGPDGQVIELERESRWDYFRSRRATEEWNYDDWVLARNNQGPQLAAPEALA